MTQPETNSILHNHLAGLTWSEAGILLRSPANIGLLPVGAIEAHGPHLPLFTDVHLSLELCQRISDQFPNDPTIILPPMTLAVTNYAAGFPGTISLRRETELALLTDVVDSLARHGLRRIALVNSHLEPGHIAVLEEFARRPRERPRVLFVNHCRKPWALELGDEFKSGDCHAGRYETSLLLASRHAGVVRSDLLPALKPARHGLVAKMKAGVGTFEEMGATEAYFGEPAAASRAEGERLWAVLVRMWVEEIRRNPP